MMSLTITGVSSHHHPVSMFVLSSPHMNESSAATEPEKMPTGKTTNTATHRLASTRRATFLQPVAHRLE